MDWIEYLNNAIAYIEEHMTEELDYEQVAKTACCSSFLFQRMFSYIAGVSLSTYIKRRKMSLAASDLQNGEKVIDVALKYGYTSPTAFNRAFQSIHGIAPSHVKEDGVTLKSYPKINFKLIAKGVEEMEFRIEKHDAIRVVGVSTQLSKDVEKAYEEGAALWAKVLFEDIKEDLNGYSNGKICCELNAAGNFRAPDGSLPKYNGFFGIEAEHNNGGEYIIAVASPMPENNSLKEYIIPAHTWAIF
jgi:AraC family transcriptional regulator